MPKQWDERVLQRLKLRDLRVLVTVAKTGSMGKTAAQLAMSQPAVSKAIAEVERTLGVQLLDRSAHGVETTLYGNALLKWAIAVFDDLRQAAHEMQSLSNPASGQIRIGTTDSMIAGFIPGASTGSLRSIRRLYSKCCRYSPSPINTKICVSVTSTSFSGDSRRPYTGPTISTRKYCSKTPWLLQRRSEANGFAEAQSSRPTF
jgi:hypothetical protein